MLREAQDGAPSARDHVMIPSRRLTRHGVAATAARTADVHKPDQQQHEHQDQDKYRDAGNKERSMREVSLRALLHAPELAHEVRKLNRGVLPVQCPDHCYKRAVTNDHAQLSLAAGLFRMAPSGSPRAASRLERTPGKRKRGSTEVEGSASDDAPPPAMTVVGGLLAEHDAIHGVVHIQTLAVDMAYRRRGIARRLVETVAARAEALPRVRCVQLHVHVTNEDALAFYTALGFVEHQRLEHYYRRLTPSTCIVLQRPVQHHAKEEKENEQKEEVKGNYLDNDNDDDNGNGKDKEQQPQQQQEGQQEQALEHARR